VGELAAGLLQLFLGCGVMAFLIELALNRRPLLVAFIVALIACLVLAGSAIAYLGFSDVHGALEMLSIVLVLSFVAALIGSALARAIRLAMQKARLRSAAGE
jgi:hypothetical protein